MINNKKIKNKSAIVWVWLSILIILIDQVSKSVVNHYLILNESVVIFPWLNLTLRYNPGAAFSFLHDASGWQVYWLSGISILVSFIIIIWLFRFSAKDWLKGTALSLILGGAIGNLIDRVRFHYVIDFIDFHIHNWHFATFNIADSAISVGAFLLILKLLFFSND